jgi:TetR/AcrR family transcriptional repressor of nem operon
VKFGRDESDQAVSGLTNGGVQVKDLGEIDAKPVFRTRLDGVLSAWERRLVDCLEQAQADGQVPADLDPSALAAFIMAGWEGAILRAKTVKSPAPMECFEEILFTRVLTPGGLIPS